MNEQELRVLVREAVERHLGAPAAAGLQARGPASVAAGLQPRGHYSHGRFLTLVKAGEECVIEPTVPCNHCGYCESHGH